MKNKVVVITGATSGIGRIAAEELAARGARIVFVARDKTRGEATLARLRERGSGTEHRALYGDLSLLREMERIGLELASTEPRIDVLMNNAGAIFDRRHETEDGLEQTFALNHMSYFVMTCLLRSRLLATPGARVVSTASAAHRYGRIDFSDLQSTAKYGAFKAYGNSKLYNILFTRELTRRLQGSGVTANSLHPGFVATRFADGGGGAGVWILRFLKVFALSPAEGAKTMIHLASSEQVAGVSGEYFDKCVPVKPTANGQNDMAAKRLWGESEKIAGVAWG